MRYRTYKILSCITKVATILFTWATTALWIGLCIYAFFSKEFKWIAWGAIGPFVGISMYIVLYNEIVGGLLIRYINYEDD